MGRSATVALLFYMDLTLVRLIIDTPAWDLQLLAPFVTGKGKVFEDTLRSLCCSLKNHSCLLCPLSTDCPVSILTGRQLSPDSELVQRHQKPGLPYIFEALSDETEKNVKLGLVLLGSAYVHLPLFLAAVKQLALNNGDYRTAGIDYQNNCIDLNLRDSGDTDTLPILSMAELLAQSNHSFAGCKRVQLSLHTPVRILHKGRELRYFDPVFFIRSLLRRLSSLAAYYGCSVDQEIFHSLYLLAGTVHVVKALDRQQCNPVCGRGVTGSYVVSGDFDLLGPFLAVGSMLHLGKGASYGLGAFEVIPNS